MPAIRDRSHARSLRPTSPIQQAVFLTMPCKDIDERVNAFLDRQIDGEWPYLWLDATYLKVRDGGRIVSVAAIIAVAVTTDGRREIIGLGIGPSEAEPCWSAFLKGLVKRGLKGVKLVISDAH